MVSYLIILAKPTPIRHFIFNFSFNLNFNIFFLDYSGFIIILAGISLK